LTFISKQLVFLAGRARLEVKMKQLLIASLLMIVLLVSSASGFDGKRKGFVLGGGLGIAPVGSSTLKISEIFLLEDIGSPRIEVDKAGSAANLFAGYAWDELNVIVLETNLIRYTSDSFYKRRVIQGFIGPTWYHYLQPQGSSLFTSLGIGLYVFDIKGLGNIDPGLGLMVGAGYEFARHFQITSHLSYGKTSEKAIGSGKDVGIEHKHLSVLVRTLVF
jgi:hypothetical protein